MQENWIWGFHSLEAFLENYPELILDLQIEESAKIPDALVKAIRESGRRLQKIRTLPKHLQEKRTQGVAAKIKHFPSLSLSEFLDQQTPGPKSLYVILDGVEDPRNFGAILRSAAAFGAKAAFVAQKNQAPLTGVVAQASAGQCFRIPVVSTPSLRKVCDYFKESGVYLAALAGGGGVLLEKSLGQLSKDYSSIAWIVGSEGEGIRSSLLELCDAQVRIPLAEGVESLNASVAASVALYASQQKIRSL